MSTINVRSLITSREELFKEGAIKRLFDTTAQATKTYFEGLVLQEKANDYFDRDRQIAGLGLASKVADGQPAPSDVPVLGGYKDYTQAKYMLSFRMTEGMNMFNKYDIWGKLTKSLARSMKLTKDIEVHKMFNGPTSTTLDCGTGFDGLAIANAAHTGLAAGTTTDNYSNYLNASLSYSALDSARYYFDTLKDDRGVVIGGEATHLVYEPTLDPTARELLGSSLKAHEQSNTTNIYADYLTRYPDPRLTSTTAWFVMDKKHPLFDFHVKTAMEPKLVIQDAPDTTGDRIAVSRQWFSYGWGDPRAIYWGKA